MVYFGCTVSPPIVSVSIGDGWVIGEVKEKYLKYEAAGDQYVGRCTSGFDHMSKYFSISLPNVDYTKLNR